MTTRCPPSSSINSALLATDSQPIPVQLSPPSLSLWTVSSLTDNHWTTPIMYTSSTNYTKALTETMGRLLWLQTPITTPPQPLHPDPQTPTRCWMLRDSVAALAINPLLATFHVMGGSFSLYCAVWSSKNLMCHCLGRIYASMSAHSRPLMLSASDMNGWNVNSELKWISNCLCLYFSLYDFNTVCQTFDWCKREDFNLLKSILLSPAKRGVDVF